MQTSDADVPLLVMIETAGGLANVEEIVAVDGVDGLYVGPSDLSLALGAAFPGDPAVGEALDAALERIKAAARPAGKAVGIHTQSGEVARRRLAEGFDVVTVSGDLVHLDEVASEHLRTTHS